MNLKVISRWRASILSGYWRAINIQTYGRCKLVNLKVIVKNLVKIADICYIARMEITIKDIQESPEKFYQMLIESQAELASYKVKYSNLLEEIRLAKQYRFGSSSEKNILQSDLFDEPGIELPEEVKEQLSDEIEVRSYIRKKHPVRRPTILSSTRNGIT
jgi:hypothetical protein